MTCVICEGEDHSSFAPKFPKCDENVSHGKVCASCLRKYINSKMHIPPDEIPCIICQEPIPDGYLLNSLKWRDEELKSKRESILLSKALEGLQIIKCHLCENVQEYCEEDTFMICKNHEPPAKTCIKHKTKWHDGETCDEYDARISCEMKEEERQSEEEITKYNKCPQCNRPYFKGDENECDRLICVACNYKFCGKCGADYNLILQNDNTFHKETCPYHSNYLE